MASTLYKMQITHNTLKMKAFYDPNKKGSDFLIKTFENKIIPIEVK